MKYMKARDNGISNKKKVLFFTTGRIGGASRMVITISKFLDPLLYEVEYVVIDKRAEEIVNFIPSQKYHFIHIRHNWDLLTYKLVHLFRQERPAIVFGSLNAFNPRIILAAKIVGGIKTIVRSNNEWDSFRWDSKLQMYLLYPKANVIIAQQEEMRQGLIRNIPACKKNCITLQNPLDIDAIEQNIKQPSPYNNENETRFLWIGRIIYSKGHDVLLEAFIKVKNIIPNAHLYVVGKIYSEDPYYKKLMARAKEANVEKYIHYVGFQSNPHIWQKYCDCFVLPSRKEGLPNVLIDAMYCKVPVVATECRAVIKRIVKEGYNGYVVPVNDPTALAEAMQKALHLHDFHSTYVSASPEDFRDLFK